MPSGETSEDERSRETDYRSLRLPSEDDSTVVVPERERESAHWSRWHYGIYLGTALLLAGVVRGSLALLLLGYVLVPITMHLDSRYVESVTLRWQRDTGLYLVGCLLFPVLMIPMYLYRRHELLSV